MRRLIAVALSALILASTSAADNLWKTFVNPPDAAKTKVWWFHGETESTEEGIDADLSEFRDKGVGGVVFYDQVHGKGNGASPSMSPRWWELLKHAARKSKELGLTFEVAVGNGYVAGGPWITPELGMKKTEFIDTLVSAPSGGIRAIIPPPPNPNFRDIVTVMFRDKASCRPILATRGDMPVSSNDTIINYVFDTPVEVCGISYLLSPRGKGSTGSMNIPGRPADRYFAAGYIDYPPIGQLEYSPDGGQTWTSCADLLSVENNIGHKSRRRTISFPSVKSRHFRLHIHDWKMDDGRTKPITITDVTLYPRDIVDNIEVKTGLRTEVTYPAPAGGDREAIAMADIINVTDSIDSDGSLRLTLPEGEWRVLRLGYVPTGARTKHGRKNLLGYEADVMSAQAANLQYDNYFKVICDTLTAIGCKPQGMTMDSHEAGTQNWTQGLEEIFSNANGYDLLAWAPALCGYIVVDRESTERVLLDFRKTIASTIAHNFYGTFAERCRRDGVDYTSQAMLNIETDNLASRGQASKPQGEFWAYQKDGNYDCLDAASAAHLYGHNIASGEAFTDTPYESTWDELLRIANIAYCRGINEFVVCASTHQPWLDRKYDDSASAHPYIFHRLNPAWDSVAPFWNYQARCSSLLREGEPAVDLAIYIGENPPLKTFAFKLPVLPDGYNFDVVNNDALMNRFKADHGEVSVEGGMRYKAIIVQRDTYISPLTLVRLLELEAEGVPVIWCNEGQNVAEQLAAHGINPDITLGNGDDPAKRVLFFHRRLDRTDIYFLYNHTPVDYVHNVTLRPPHSKGNKRSAKSIRKAELWDPYTVTKTALTPAPDGSLPVHLAPYHSTFLIVRH